MQDNGLLYLFDGFNLIFKPGLRRYVIIPLIINIFLFVSLFFLANYFFLQFNIWFTHFLPEWLQWLSYILWMVFCLGFFLFVLYTFVTLANLVSAPFNSLLAEQVERVLTGKAPDTLSIWETLKDTPRIMGRQLAIIGYYLPRAFAILLLFFIPIIQMGAALIWFLFNGWFMTLQYVDYPTDNHRIPLEKVRVLMSERRFLSLSFGVSVLFGTMLPIVNFFIMPAAVAGATKLWVENQPS